MFELLNTIRSELTGVPLQPAPARLNERFEIIKDTITRLYQSAVPQNQTNINVYTGKVFHIKDFGALGTSMFGTENPSLKVSPLLLISSEEIPERFRFTSVNDPRLNDYSLLQQYYDWLSDKIEMPRATLPSNFQEAVKTYVDSMQDRQKAKQGLKFFLMHELGHIYNNDPFGIPQCIISISIVAVSLSLPIGIAVALSWPVLLSIPFVIVTACISNFALSLISNLTYDRYVEQRADMFAAEHCPDSIDGGIHLFKSTMAINKIKRNDSMIMDTSENIITNFFFWITNKIIENKTSPEGDNNVDFEHPPLSQRIAYLEAFKARRQPGITLPATTIRA